MKLVSVMGTIGAGKSTLVAAAGIEDGVVDYVEIIVPAQLARYLAQRECDAAVVHEFQTSMMLAACQRYDCAVRTLRSQPHATLVVERPPLENVVFARANRLKGWYSDALYAAYRSYMASYMAHQKAPVAHVPVFLWTERAGAGAGIRDRARAGEVAAYTQDDYMDVLEDCYFWWLIELHLRALVHRQGQAAFERDLLTPSALESPLGGVVPVVLDWRQYGTWADNVAPLVARSMLPEAAFYRVPTRGEAQFNLGAIARGDVASRATTRRLVFEALTFEHSISLFVQPLDVAAVRAHLSYF